MYPLEALDNMAPLKVAIPIPKSSAVDSMPRQYFSSAFNHLILHEVSWLMGVHTFILEQTLIFIAKRGTEIYAET